jgi:glycosyltransferase involved in cell wall biosynthesis
VYLICAGEGSARPRLEARARALGIAERVRFIGHVDDVRPLLAAADIVVSASDSNEGVPQALAQALAMERPVVATAVGSVAELVQHEVTGLLVPPQDVPALAGAIERMLLDPSLAAASAARGRAHVVAHYSLTGMLKQTLALYERLLVRGTPGE